MPFYVNLEEQRKWRDFQERCFRESYRLFYLLGYREGTLLGTRNVVISVLRSRGLGAHPFLLSALDRCNKATLDRLAEAAITADSDDALLALIDPSNR